MPDEPKKPHGLTGRTGRKSNSFKKKDERHSQPIRFFCTPEQEKRYNAGAKRLKVSLSEFIRDTLDTSIL